ncbi:MAG TPA: MarR family winged helix-turn-helix transcriptional regulator [Cyclobacteriaceae bacterium]|nr:MarR family winged helix-turn-helix transcriptional regulator [Cyclobacteriaceae bacterium]
MKQSIPAAVRDFNRFYTAVIGLLDRHVLNSAFSLPEARILYALYHTPACTARELMEQLPIDKGYLSRVLASFTKKGLVVKKKSREDGRAAHLLLTHKGKTEFEKLDTASDLQIKHIMKNISDKDQLALVQHMLAIKKILHSSLL